MSNRVKLTSEMRDKHILVEALNALGIASTVHEENAVVEDYYGHAVTKNASVKVSKCVGFAYNENGELEMVGDTHFEKGLLTKKNAIDKIQQVYKAMNVYKSLQAAGYAVEADFSNATAAEEIYVTANVPMGV